MESDRRGRFDNDYPGNSSVIAARTEAIAEASVGVADSGAFSQERPCEVNFSDLQLEEVAQCEFFQSRHSLPPPGAPVEIRKINVDGRLVVETISDRVVVGLVPAEWNHLRMCMEDGFRYVGEVNKSVATRYPFVTVDLHHER